MPVILIVEAIAVRHHTLARFWAYLSIVFSVMTSFAALMTSAASLSPAGVAKAKAKQAERRERYRRSPASHLLHLD